MARRSNPASESAFTIPEAARAGQTGRTDEELLERCRAGQRDALEELFRRYYQAVYVVASFLLGNRDAAEDAAQEACLKAFAKLGSFQGRSSFKTWLLRIVTNVAMDQLDHRRREQHPPEPRSRAAAARREARRRTVEPDTQLNRLLWQEVRDEVADILAREEDRMQWIVNLRWAELTYQEIAAEIGLSPETVRKALADWRGRLRQELEARGLSP